MQGVNSACKEVREQTYLFVGILVRNHVDIDHILFGNEYMSFLLDHLHLA